MSFERLQPIIYTLANMRDPKDRTKNATRTGCFLQYLNDGFCSIRIDGFKRTRRVKLISIRAATETGESRDV